MKSKWIWLVACVAAAGAYLFDYNPGTRTALTCVVFLPLIGMLPLLFKPRLQMELHIPISIEKNRPVQCKLRVSNQRVIPVFGLDVLAQCRNIRTGLVEEKKHRFSLLPKQEKELEFLLESPYCGQLQMSMQAESCGDLFGLQRRKLSYRVEKEPMVLPALFQTQIQFGDQAMAIPDSEIYSTEKPGSDPGEIFAIREYVPGDAIRQIHWKLSEKCDKTMVREFGLQVANDMLILLETTEAASVEESDAITEVFASLCQALADMGILFQAGWRDPKIDSLRLQTVSSPGDFPNLLSQLMSLPPKEEGSVAKRFTERFDQCKFSHVIIVGSQIPEGVQDLYNDNRITVLMPRSDDVREGLQPDGSYVLQFDCKTYTAELSALEV